MTIEQLIGNTPLVEIRTLNPNKNVTIYGKLEMAFATDGK